MSVCLAIICPKISQSFLGFVYIFSKGLYIFSHLVPMKLELHQSPPMILQYFQLCAIESDNLCLVWIVIFLRKIVTSFVNTFSYYIFISHISKHYSKFFYKKFKKIQFKQVVVADSVMCTLHNSMK